MLDRNVLEQVVDDLLEENSLNKNMYYVVSNLSSNTGKDSVKNYIYDKCIKKVVIYGAGCIGRVLCDVLNEIAECRVIGVVDRECNTEYGFSEFTDIADLQNIEYDLRIVTPLKAYEAIERALKQYNVNNYCNVLELLDYKRKGLLDETGIFG